MGRDFIQKISNIVAKINEKNPYYLIIGVMVLLLVVDFFLFMHPQMKILMSLNPEITEMSRDIKTTENNIKRLPQYRTELTSLGAQIDVINEKIKSREEIPMILENISRIASLNGVRIDQIVPNTGVIESVLKNDKGEYFAIPIVLEAKSGYHDFGRFMNQLEEDISYFQVPSFMITTNAANPRKHNIQLTINAVVFEGL